MMQILQDIIFRRNLETDTSYCYRFNAKCVLFLDRSVSVIEAQNEI